MHCFYLQRVRIHFTKFSIESGYDNVFVYDGGTTSDPLLRSATGTGLPGDVTTNGNVALVRYKTDVSIILSGFTIQYSTIPGKFTITFLLCLRKIIITLVKQQLNYSSTPLSSTSIRVRV